MQDNTLMTVMYDMERFKKNIKIDQKAINTICEDSLEKPLDEETQQKINESILPNTYFVNRLKQIYERLPYNPLEIIGKDFRRLKIERYNSYGSNESSFTLLYQPNNIGIGFRKHNENDIWKPIPPEHFKRSSKQLRGYFRKKPAKELLLY